MRKIIILIFCSLIFVGCAPIPTYLSGHILKDEATGKRYKLEWAEGQGNKWYIYEEAKLSNDGAVIWIRARDESSTK